MTNHNNRTSANNWKTWAMSTTRNSDAFCCFQVQCWDWQRFSRTALRTWGSLRGSRCSTHWLTKQWSRDLRYNIRCMKHKTIIWALLYPISRRQFWDYSFHIIANDRNVTCNFTYFWIIILQVLLVILFLLSTLFIDREYQRPHKETARGDHRHNFFSCWYHQGRIHSTERVSTTR